MNTHILSALKRSAEKDKKDSLQRVNISNKHAVFIETRNLEHLELVVSNHLKYLPNDWSYEVICSHDNKHRFSGFFDGISISILPNGIDSIDSYNKMLTNVEFWGLFGHAEKVLICQYDSFFVGNHIDNFIDYDYIGAGWTFQDKGGNGGFSLRSRAKMIETINQVPYSPIHGNEDVYFCNHMKGRVCTRDEGQQFSTEAIFSLGTVGCHAIDKYLSEEQVKQITDQL